MPLESINRAAVQEKRVKVGKPTNIHHWWARLPLAAARSIIFAQMVDDPSEHPDQFPSAIDQEKERQRLFRLVEKLALWENIDNDEVLQEANNEIWKNWRSICAANKDHPQASEMFNSKKLVAFHDPFAGGGALPLEAQRLGLESHASDLNPVAVLLNKAMIEIPPKFTGKQPINPELHQNKALFDRVWSGSKGIAEDIRYYGNWMKDEAEKRIGSLYPQIDITPDIVQERPDLRQYINQKLTVISWLWVRTVKSPNPRFNHVDVPLASTFMLSVKGGKQAYVEPIVDGDRYSFAVKVGQPTDVESYKKGTRTQNSGGSGFQCLLSGTPITFEYIRNEATNGRMGERLMAVVGDGRRGRVYLPAMPNMESTARKAEPTWIPEVEFFQQALGFRIGNYGMAQWCDLFTRRQLVALKTFCDVLRDVQSKVLSDASGSHLSDDNVGLQNGGTGTTAYAEAISVYLGLAISRLADWNNSLSRWESTAQVPQHLFSQQTIQITWDYSECNPFSSSTGSFIASVNNLVLSFNKSILSESRKGFAYQQDARTQTSTTLKVCSTDPPFYDNIGYADLSDFFYVWLRHAIQPIFPELFSTIVAPKSEELVATPSRHGGKDKANSFFLEGMTQAMQCLAKQAHPAYPVTIYYAMKQSEKSNAGITSTGWSTFLEAVLNAGLRITGTWPVRTQNPTRQRALNSNALASSIVLVCRPKSGDEKTVTRQEFINSLRSELTNALSELLAANTAPVDLAQAQLGPGMEIFTRYNKVLDSSGTSISVSEVITLIGQISQEILTEREDDFDADTRWALGWFESYGFSEAEYGVAENLAVATDTSVAGMRNAGILTAGRGVVQLIEPEGLPLGWNPQSDRRFTTWEAVHHLVRVLQDGGEVAAAELQAKIGPASSEPARELAYRLYSTCERKGWDKEALWYNSLVQSWPEITRLARTEQQGNQGTLI
jgi:putative DNA methylase